MQKLITFSIAGYNIEPFIHKCLGSFICDDMDKIEVVIVNDGSKDNTLTLAKEYAEKYPETFVVIDKENGGHGSTINAALKIARGKYFRPIDGDDWIQTENLPAILSALENTDADVIINDYVEFYENTNETKLLSYNFLPALSNFEFDSIEILEKTFYFHCLSYKTETLRNHHFAVAEKVFYEDTEYSLYPFAYMTTCFYIPQVLYCYRLGRPGQSVSEESKLKHFRDICIIVTNLFDFYSKLKPGPKLKDYFVTRMKDCFDFFYNQTETKMFFEDKNRQKLKKQCLKKAKKTNSQLLKFYIGNNKFRKIQYLTGWNFDVLLFKLWSKKHGI